MAKPKAAFLIAQPLRDVVFEPDVLARICELVDPIFATGAQKLTPSQAGELLADAELAVCSWGSPRLDAAVLAHAPALRRVIYSAGSVKPIISETLAERGIEVTSGAAMIAEGVAETTLGLIISCLRNIYRLSRDTRSGHWRETDARQAVKSLFNSTIGVVGAGYVGRAVLRNLQPFSPKILLCDPYVTVERAKQLGATKAELNELLSSADLVTLHVPSLPSTRHLLNASNLGLLKDGAILLNTARGTLIDEAALIAELERGRIFCCLDVTDPEPPSVDHPFRRLENVILTPHIAGGADSARPRLGRLALQEIQAFVEGRPPLYPVDLSRLDQIA